MIETIYFAGKASEETRTKLRNLFDYLRSSVSMISSYAIWDIEYSIEDEECAKIVEELKKRGFKSRRGVAVGYVDVCNLRDEFSKSRIPNVSLEGRLELVQEFIASFKAQVDLNETDGLKVYNRS
jgi:hypothetical protein